jgi:hypothetical protein
VQVCRNSPLQSQLLLPSKRVQIRPDNSDGWLSLGLSHAENDNDVAAIAALGKAVEANGCTGCCCVRSCGSHSANAVNNLEALMALGVAHTNELSQIQVMIMMMTAYSVHANAHQALHYLQDWLARHPKYRDVRSPKSRPQKPTAHPIFMLAVEWIFHIIIVYFCVFVAFTWREQVPAAHAQGEDSLGARVTSMFEHASRLDDGEQGSAAAAAAAAA